MSRRSRHLALIVVSFLTLAAGSSLGGSTARACSCASVDPVDAVGIADIVFTGTVVSNEGSEFEPVWEFDVDGVVKGDVSPSETVVGDDWAAGCGTDFSRFDQSIVVYAAPDGDRLRALGCMPTPSADAFASRLAEVSEPKGSGPPAAVMVGNHGANDLAVLDGEGRTIGRDHLGLDGAAVAHCAGTSLVAVVSTDTSDPVSIVDLATMTVVEQRPLRSGFLSVAGDRVECLDGGRLVVASSGYGPNNGSVVVAASSSGDDASTSPRRTLDGVSRTVVHPAGTVLVLPTIVGDPIRLLGAESLEPLDVAVPLPEGASTIDGDVSPDGTRLAVLATLSGNPVEYDTGATHVVVLDVVAGVPVADGTQVVPLDDTGGDIESPDGAAKWIRWVDADTWFVESETVSSKLARFVATDGTVLLAPTDIGWGWGAAPLDGGVLRARNGGLEILGLDGVAVDGDPAPPSDDVDRILALDDLVDAPAFDVPTSVGESLTIRPVTAVDGETGAPPDSTVPSPTDPEVTPATEPASSTPPGSVPTDAPSSNDDGTGVWPWAVGAALVVAALLVGGVALARRRRA